MFKGVLPSFALFPILFKKPVSWLSAFIMIHVVLWTLVPLLTRKTLPMDSLEAIVWGGFAEMGTNKHPPLSGFLIAPFYELLAENPLAVYLLSQICIAVGFIFIYKLAKIFLSKEKAGLATMLMEGVIYYTITSAEYNVNIVSLALWPMNVYYFYQALKSGKLNLWTIFGLISALNVLNKYVSGVLFIPMLFVMLFTKEGRAAFKSFGAYLSVLVAIVVCLPHLLWLWQYDFYTIFYFMGRASDGNAGLLVDYPWLKHLLYPVKFFLAQVLAGTGTILIYFAMSCLDKRNNGGYERANIKAKYTSDAVFIAIMALGPLLVFILLSAATGVYLKSMWGTPLLYMLTIALFYFFPVKETAKNSAFIRKMVYAIMAFFAVIAGSIYLFGNSVKVNLDSKVFAQEMKTLWTQENPDRPLHYVGGDIWLSSNVSLYLPEKPSVVAENIENNPWLNRDDITAKGALILVTYPEACAAFSPNATEPQKISLKVTNYFGKHKEKSIYYCFIK